MPAKIAFVIASTATAITNLDNRSLRRASSEPRALKSRMPIGVESLLGSMWPGLPDMFRITKRLAAAFLLLLLVAAPAAAAQFTVTLALAGGGTLTKTIPLTDDNAQRIISAYRIILAAPPGATSQAVWDRIGQGLFDGVKANTISQETEAQRSAIVVAPIE